MAQKQIIKPKKISYTMSNSLVNYYLLIMFTLFELFLVNGYYNVRTSKYWFFVITTAIFSVGVITLSLIAHFDRVEKEKQAPLQTSNLKMSVTDYAFVLFFVFACITTVFSDYKFDSLTGNAGRNNGLILLSLYLVIYFIISRFYYYKEYVLIAFMVCASIISLLAIVNFFYIDPLGIFDGLEKWYVDNFGTTIGNKNYIAIYMCIFLSVALMMFIVYKQRYMKILCGIAIGCAYCGLITSASNSGYIGLFAMLFATTAVCIRKPELLRSFMLGITIMFASGITLRLFSLFMDKNKGFEAIGKKLVFGTTIFYILIALVAITLVLYLLKDVQAINTHWPKNTLMILVLVVGIGIIAAGGYLIYYYSVVDTTTDLGSLNRLLRFNERWGTHRGVMWIGGMEEYLDFNIFDKLFGRGCDTFYYIYKPHFDELLKYGGDTSTDCAHNEYINYLVTQGLLGLLAYMTVIISTIYRAFKTSKDNLLSLVFVMPIIAYCAQAVVNIYQPVNTPFLILFVALSEALSRKTNPMNHI